jgi:hypothetical protein
MEERNRAKMYINLHILKTPVRNEGQDMEWYLDCGKPAQASGAGLTAWSVPGGNIGPPPGLVVRPPPGLVVRPPPGL